MKKTFRHLAIILPIVLVLFLASFALEERTRAEQRVFYEEQPLVYVTKTGECYHSYGCNYLSRSRIPKGLYQAKREGYRRCSVCDGVAYGTVQVAVKAPYEIADLSCAIFFSFAKTACITPLIYFPVYKLLKRTNYYNDAK